MTTSNIVYITKGTVADMGGRIPTMFDAMLEAQADLGQVTWDCLSPTVAVGWFGGQAETAHNRIAIFDLDNADGMDVIRVTNYVNGHTDEMPELKF